MIFCSKSAKIRKISHHIEFSTNPSSSEREEPIDIISPSTSAAEDERGASDEAESNLAKEDAEKPENNVSLSVFKTLSLQVNMEWVLVNPQINSAFGSLGYIEGDTYHINEDCLNTLEEIYKKLGNEDKNLRTFRRAVGFGQNIKKDLVPILIHVKDDPKILELTIKILVNLTIPIECLLSMDELSKNNVGRHTIFELNNLLLSSKEAFVDNRVTKSLLDYTNRIYENDRKLSPSSIDSINDCLLLIRNILHIPEIKSPSAQALANISSQNQLLWHLFTHGIDKTLLILISSPYGTFWCVAIVQLIALIYKDQHISTLQKLLNLWFESSLSDSSEDNESNTSPPEQVSDDSSPTVTSDPTSDNSDNGKSTKTKENQNKVSKMEVGSFPTPDFCKPPSVTKQNSSPAGNKFPSPQTPQAPTIKPPLQRTHENEKKDANDKKDPELIVSNSAIINNRLKNKRGPTTPLSNLTCSGPSPSPKRECMSTNSEFSDLGYVTQMENRESISTSSNEDEEQKRKPVHQKPHVQKHKHCVKLRQIMSAQEKKEKRRKRLIKRGRTSIINMKGLMHHVPTNDDITNVLKEFTVDFLLKGFGYLIKSLHTQLIYNVQLQIDTSHFFWLLTYFLKFAAQLELDLEFVNQVFTFEIISYLTYEGVYLCEQIQLADKINKNDLQSCLRRLHLVITAIREFIQTIEIYKKFTHLTDEDHAQLIKLQIRICSAEDLRCLFVLLLRHYQPDIHSKQFLQDLIVTNHTLLLFLDSSLNRADGDGKILMEHIQQFATLEVMHQYGLLLEDFETNGEYVNDCIFTMMHHVGGDLNRISVLFQPNILNVFLKIWESGFEICEDWSDLLDYVINTFMKNPKPPSKLSDSEISEPILESPSRQDLESERYHNSWSEEDENNLQWWFMQCHNEPNLIENICSRYRDEGITKSHNSVVKHLFMLGLISESSYRQLLICAGSKSEIQEYFKCSTPLQGTSSMNEIEMLTAELERENMSYALRWLQKVLLEVCFTKICLKDANDKGELNFNKIIPTMEPVVFHNILMNQSIPLVPWNNEQSTAIHNQTFLILLHRLGFHLPVDSGKLFVRIPNFWTADVLFEVASRLGPIDKTALKFTIQQDFASGSMSDTTEKSEKMETTYSDSVFTTMDAKLRIRTKTINSVVEVTELTMPNLSIKETKISTIEEKSNSWLDVVMKSKQSGMMATHSRYESPKPHILSMITSNVKISSETNMGPPMCGSMPLYENSHMNLPTSEDNSLCETASVASDLTRMYVSDEEDKFDGTIL